MFGLNYEAQIRISLTLENSSGLYRFQSDMY
jgi:hypothetical protein